MNIPLKTWMKYKDKLAAIDRRAEVEMISFVQSIGGYGDHVNECINYAFTLATKYGEAAGAAACELYEAVAAASGITLEAMPAATATYEEVAKSLNGIHKISNDPAKLSQGVSRLVKRTAADTTLQNAVRDGAYFAWVPSGDTCAFCLMLASNGWRKAGKKTLKGDHAEHIHANCDCQYAVTFDPLSGVEGYDPAEYEAMFEGIDGDWNKKVNVVRLQQYAENKERINAQQRAAYARRNNKPEDERELTERLQFIYNGFPEFIPLHTVIKNPYVMAGKGADKEIRDVDRLVAVYQRDESEWKKMAGSVKSEKYKFDIHWYECDDQIVLEPKIKYMKELRKK